MTRPTVAKVSHISFSARDAERSAVWWRETFALEEVDRTAGDGWTAVLLIHPETATIIEFQQHDANEGETFDPRRTGFDHMGFLVKSADQLDEWQAHFEGLGITHTAVTHRDYGSVLTFKDPDGIQFEMFYREGHP